MTTDFLPAALTLNVEAQRQTENVPERKADTSAHMTLVPFIYIKTVRKC